MSLKRTLLELLTGERLLDIRRKEEVHVSAATETDATSLLAGPDQLPEPQLVAPDSGIRRAPRGRTPKAGTRDLK